MNNDELFMRQAIAEAEKTKREQEVPVGAVIVKDGRIISRGRNRPISRNDPTSHAEIEALRSACRKIGNYRLTGCEIYVTLEPCAMCLGAMVQSRIKRLIYGAPDPKAGAVRSIMEFPLEKMNHNLEIRGGIMEEECGRVLVDFFKELRRKGRLNTKKSGVPAEARKRIRN